ncbi:efflux RND transporter periplasmic adaptor subunit [Tahibacter harae]|uniref:Efflux RND transporter periplasmic adaptor subunit n=1 Tax=Tahibacter harae TaxID=2963937 RepID=A0ABT1QT54_9GAMM|nr:efflux RND transporter periplasmic adaptor subunit [Tahibacter harae]MCQ4165447.1 efflux RND transporter periplasmic adaptor subunit [Tahibacter harae]
MKKALVLLGIVALVVLASLMTRLGRRDAVGVQVQELALHSIRSSILASGKITYDERVSLTSEIVGMVRTVHATEGGRVTKGQLVMELRDEEYAAAVEQSLALVRQRESDIERAKFNVQNAQREWERSKRLIEAKLVAKDAYEKSELARNLAQVELRAANAALLQARAQYAQVERQLGKTRIYSPIDGVVTSVDLRVGETAIPSAGGIPGSTLMVISNPDSIYTEVNVDEADIGNVKVGDEAEVVAVAYRNSPIKGQIESMATSAKVAEGRQGLSFAVKIRLDRSNTTVDLKPGMSCRAEIFTRSKSEVLAAPIQAVLVESDSKSNKSSHHVFVNRGGVATKVAVETGISDDNYYEITKGASAGEQIITGPDKVLQSLRQGDPVKAIAPERPAAPAAAPVSG